MSTHFAQLSSSSVENAWPASKDSTLLMEIAFKSNAQTGIMLISMETAKSSVLYAKFTTSSDFAWTALLDIRLILAEIVFKNSPLTHAQLVNI